MKTIPLMRPYFDDKEVAMVARCLQSGWVTQGPMVQEFEKRFAALHGVKHALATTSCTTALHLATLAAGLGPGDEAIVPAYTWVTSANCIEYTGARAVLADIDLETFNLDPARLEETITPKTRAIVVVHLFGLSARMDRIMEIAEKRGLKVIEDAACAVNSRFDGKPVGGIGDLGCFSFHPRKAVTTGEGGMVTTNNDSYAEEVASLRNHGLVKRPLAPGERMGPYHMEQAKYLGYNFRLSDIQGAVGLAQLDKLPEIMAERKMWAARYDEALRDLADLILPVVPPKAEHTYQSYVVRVRKGGKARRNKIMDALAAEGIQTRPGTHAVHRLDFYKKRYNFAPEQFPNASRAEDETITLPIFHKMGDDVFSFIAGTLRKVVTTL